jgi:hypothetical protein
MVQHKEPLAVTVRVTFGVLLALALLFAACAQPTAAVTTAPDATQVPAITLTSTPEPTRTPLPALELSLVHECPAHCNEPPLGLPSEGVSLLSRLSAGYCFYGEIGLFEAGGRLYTAQTIGENKGQGLATFMISDVTDPTQPKVVGAWQWNYPTYTADVKPFSQGDHLNLAVARDPYPEVTGSSESCARVGGVAIVEVTKPEAPRLVTVLTGRVAKAFRPWCNAHTVQVSEDEAGNGAYLYVAAVDHAYLSVVDIRDLANVREAGRYVHPDAGFYNPRNTFLVHDTTLEDNRVYVAYWSAGVVILDREQLEAGRAVEPLNPLDSIDPWGLQIHHTYPVSAGQFLFVEDEVNMNTGRSQVLLYDIRDLAKPKEVAELNIDSDWGSPHNLLVADDRLYVGWYQDGVRIFKFDLSDPDHPLVEPYAYQAVRTGRTRNPDYGDLWDGIWGVRLHKCQVGGRSTNCIYASDLTYGLLILEDAP